MTDSPDNHKENIKTVFDIVAEGYDNPAMRFFPLVAEMLVGALKPRSGQKVLDICSGTGAVATACAQAILPDGRVIAIDFSEAMLGRAMQKASHQGLTNIDFFNMDADHLEFGANHFDHAVCSFGLFFLPDMQHALKEWLSVVKPGGCIMFTSFTELAFMPMVEVFVADLESMGVEFEESPLKSQRLSSVDQCMDLMQSVGLEDVGVEIQQMGYHMQCVDDWWSIVNFSGLRGLLDRLNEKNKGQFRMAHLENIHSMFTDKGLWLNVEVLVSQGKVPPMS